MSEYRYTLNKFFKDWMLVICMIAGAGGYLIYRSIPALHSAGPVLDCMCKKLQPALLFLMLFLSFCKIEPSAMRLRKWHAWLLMVQALTFTALSLLLIWARGNGSPFAAFVQTYRVVFEAAMLCLICPTATACAVVTGKLGGDMAGVVTYTVLVNLMVAVLVPLFVPLVYPVGGITFLTAFWKILGKVFPLLIVPCLAAWLVRWIMPRLHKWLLAYVELSFYIWAISLTLAIAISTRYIVQSGASVSLLAWIAVATLVCCVFQFWTGKFVGNHYGSRITAGQALGQKNTVFAIWMGYTFLDPLSSVAGGFYSLWHNTFNTWQLYRRRIGKL